METAPAPSMLIPLPSGPGNGRSFAPPSRLRDAARSALVFTAVRFASSSERSLQPISRAQAAGGGTSDGCAGPQGTPPPLHSHSPGPSTHGVPLGQSQPSTSASVLPDLLLGAVARTKVQVGCSQGHKAPAREQNCRVAKGTPGLSADPQARGGPSPLLLGLQGACRAPFSDVVMCPRPNLGLPLSPSYPNLVAPQCFGLKSHPPGAPAF